MKTIKILALSIFCILSLCSCQKNYEKLALGKWRMDTDASYFTKNNKRHYANDFYKGKKTGNYEMVFLDEVVEINMITIREDGTTADEEKKTAKCHFDKDYFYVDGDAAHILKLNNKRLVIEGKSDGELTHMEFSRIEDKALKSFLKNIWYSLPLWIWIIIGVVVALLILLSWDDGGKVLLGIVVGLTVVVFSILYWDTFGVTIVGMAILGIIGWGVGSIIEAIFDR